MSVLRAGSLPGSSSCRCQRRRLIMRVRSPTRSSRWSTKSRSSRSAPSSLAMGRSGSRRAARATASASIGSLLPNERAASRAFAISFGGTLTIRSPAASKSRSRRRERRRQSSTAQRRCGKRAAHATSSRWSADVVPSVRVPPADLTARQPRRPCGCACAHRSRWSPCPLCLLHSMGEKRRTGRRAYPSGGETTLLSSHVGRSVSVSRAAQRTQATKAHNNVERARKTRSD